MRKIILFLSLPLLISLCTIVNVRQKNLKNLAQENFYKLISLKFENYKLKKSLAKINFIKSDSTTTSKGKELLVRRFLDLRRNNEIYLKFN